MEAGFVAGIDSATAVASGSDHTCALLAGGTVACWGANNRGQLGDGTYTMNRPTPVAVSGLTGAVAIAGGFAHTCAVVTGGTVKCWGDNYWGQLGLDPDLVQTSAIPVTIPF
jgi:alpha-tubulin suppressor-like RCC1 family protein